MNLKRKSAIQFTNIVLCLLAFFLIDHISSFAFDFSKVAEKYKNSIVKVFTTSNQSTGFFVSGNGHIVTCLSSIKKADQIQVMTTDGKTYVATKVRQNTKMNIAIIQIYGIERPSIVELGDSSNLKLGSWVTCGGYLNQKGVVFTAGVILTQKSNFIQTDAAAPKDYDGGPMVDQTGKVIGVIGTGYENLMGIRCGIAIPIDLIKPDIESVNKETQG